MSFTSTEEALLRQLLDQQAAILSLAGSESTIISKLGATKVTLADLTAASSVNASDLFLTRQGSTEKSATPLNIKNYIESSGMSTPERFDNDKSIATTEFVNRVGLQASSIIPVTINTILTASQAGGTILLNAPAGIGVTVPPASTMPTGTRFEFFNSYNIISAVNRSGSDLIVVGTSTALYVNLSGGDTLVLESNGLDRWFSVGGSAQLPFSSQFSASLASNGWQKLPGGRIEVQGTFTASATPGNAVSITFPVSATNFRNLQLTPVSSGTSSISAWFDTPTGLGFNGRCSAASAVVHYRAIID